MTGNVVEKAFWVVVVILGLIGSLILVSSQISDWTNNPTGMYTYYLTKLHLY